MKASHGKSAWLVAAMALWAAGCGSGTDASAPRDYETEMAKSAARASRNGHSDQRSASAAPSRGPAVGERVGSGATGRQAAPRYRPASPAPAPPEPPRPDRNAYYHSPYHGGSAERDRIESLIHRGVVVDGAQVVLTAFTNTFSQALPVPDGKALAVSAKLERSRIIRDGGRTYLQVGLQAVRSETPLRPRLNIALVIDASGSMAEDGKIRDVKQAARTLVERLALSDSLAIVSYNESARVLHRAGPVHDRAALVASIDGVVPGGNTNIEAGLRAAYEQLAEHDQDPAAVHLVILLSDGQANVGLTDAGALARMAERYFDRGIQTTSIGVGLEFNDTLMSRVALAGKGNYHFIKNAAATDAILAAELNELTHLAAKAVKVRIVLDERVELVRVLGAQQLGSEEAARVKAEEKKLDRRVQQELGIAANRQNEPDAPGLKFFIPHFHLGSSHVIMLEVAVPPGEAADSLHVADVFVKYKDVVCRENRNERLSVRAAYVHDREAMIASTDPAVKKNVLGFQTGESLMHAARLLDSGETAAAVEVIDEQMTLLGAAAQVWHDEDLDRDGALLAEYRDVLRQLDDRRLAAGSELGRYVRRSLSYSAYRLSR
jgi:Ca-activated chloride channel family protein